MNMTTYLTHETRVGGRLVVTQHIKTIICYAATVWNKSTADKIRHIIFVEIKLTSSDLHHTSQSRFTLWPAKYTHSPVWRTPPVGRWSICGGGPSFWLGGWCLLCAAAGRGLWACRCCKTEQRDHLKIFAKNDWSVCLVTYILQSLQP